MARQIGHRKISGTIDGLTNYIMKGKAFVRKKSNLDRERVLKDKAFEKSRIALRQFTRASTCSKLIRRHLAHLMEHHPQKDMHNRLIKLIRPMIQKKEKDSQKKCALNTLPWNELEGFIFNDLANTNALPLNELKIDIKQPGQVKMYIPDWAPIRKYAPDYAQRFRLTAAVACLNFNKEKSDSDEAASDYLPLGIKKMDDIQLSLQIPDMKGCPVFLAVGIIYYLETNGKLLELKNSKYSQCVIVKVLAGQKTPKPRTKTKKKRTKG